MRLKQLWGCSMLLLAATAVVSAATVPQLTGVKIGHSGTTATVSIQTTSAFTHTDYRPTDNQLIVDLPGVSAAKLAGKMENVHVAGLESYRVQSFTGASGQQVARIEMALASGATVHFSEKPTALMVEISGSQPASAPIGGPSKTEADQQVLRPATVASTRILKPNGNAKMDGNAHMGTVTAVNAADGVDLEIPLDAAVTPRVMKLTSPDRIVVDLPNTVAATHQRELKVATATVKDIRIARNQSSPPVMRIVADLNHTMDYELTTAQNKLIVKLHATGAATSAAASKLPATPVLEAKHSLEVAPKVADGSVQQSDTPAMNLIAANMNAPLAAAQEHPIAAQDFVVVQPEFKAKASASDRAADAASRFTDNKQEIALSNVPAPPMAPLQQPAAAAPSAAQPQQQPSPQSTPQPSAQQAVMQMPSGSCNTGRYTGEPISVNLKDVDVRDFFRLIHDISGLNVVLDPGVRGNLTIVLDDVPWDQALNIVLKNNGLDCQLEGNVLRIASIGTLKQEADQRRQQVEAQALAVDKTTITRYLSYATAKDVVPVLKQFLSARGEIISDDRTNSLIIQDIPSTIPNIDRLLRELDRKTQQVEIEARVVAATRNFSRDIGTALGFGFGNSSTAVGGSPSTTNVSPLINNGVAPFYFNNNGQIPLFSNLLGAATSGLSFMNATSHYRLDFILSLAESRGLLKVLSRPRIVTQNNINAVVRQGVRVPTVTPGQLNGPSTVTYTDAFLRLTVKPQITAEGTIFLNVDVENTTADFGHEVQGNPQLITQQATTQVLVADGGTVVIGGVIQTTNSVAIDQTPLLGSIPILGNLFKHTNVSTNTQELIFFITPRILPT